MTPGGAVVFLGTPAFAVPSLDALVVRSERVALVVTQPDRPRGRGRHPEPPPVAEAARRLGLPLLQIESVNTEAVAATLAALEPEFLTVVAYGGLLQRRLLALPRGGVVNLHPSLLPRHRGASPIAGAILAGDPTVGNSTMFLDEGLDEGPVLLQEAFPRPPEATRGELEDLLARTGARLLVETLQGLRAGAIEPRPQDPATATLTQLLTREQRPVDWSRPAAAVQGQVHALAPTPGAVCGVGGGAVKLLRVRLAAGEGAPGEVLALTADGPVVGCGTGAVALLEVHPEGKRPMAGAAYARGGALRVGDRLGRPWHA